MSEPGFLALNQPDPKDAVCDVVPEVANRIGGLCFSPSDG
jgi:hypothetical protein